MEWKKEIYFVGNTYDVIRCEFVNTLSKSNTTALYYNTKWKFSVVVNQNYAEPDRVLYGDELRTFTDRADAYDYAISNIKDGITKLSDKLQSYEYRKHGFCTTTIDDVTTEHEIDEYTWD